MSNKAPLAVALVLVAGALLVSVPAAAAQSAAAVAQIMTNLTSNDQNTRNQAMEALKTRLHAAPAGASQRNNDLKLAMKNLATAKRYDDILSLSQWIILDAPGDYRTTETALTARVRALLAMNKPQEALVASKCLFNAAGMDGTSDAILLIAECLIQARPDDRTAYEKFRDEQIAGATTRPSVTTRPVKSATLASIRVDGKVYEEAVANWPGEDYPALLARGNLFLLADKTAEARKIFERMYTIAPPHSLTEASECLARVMKAEDGTLGRTNLWIYSIRPKK